MAVEGKSLYNLLRMNWLQDSKIDVEPWQVEDYRLLKEPQLFKRLADLDLPLDREIFLAYAEPCESPEELAEHLVDEETGPEEADQIFLLLFELWRRLKPDVRCLTIFCDDLDYQINLYDRDELLEPDDIEDAVELLRELLEDNIDDETDPVDVFQKVADGCANDLESFLYDYIQEQLEEENFVYATELLEAFSPYLEGNRWYHFLRARAVWHEDPIEGNELLEELIEECEGEPDLELYLEILSFLMQGGERELFSSLVEVSLPLVEKESDFQDLLRICLDFFNCLDHEQEEQEVQDLLKGRERLDRDGSFQSRDPDRKLLLSIMHRFSGTKI